MTIILGNENVVDFSPAAQNKMKKIIMQKSRSEEKIYLLINGGGCKGVECKIDFKTDLEESDKAFYRNEDFVVYGNAELANIVQDVTVDFIDELVGARFVFVNKAKTGCSCGKSFSLDE